MLELSARTRAGVARSARDGSRRETQRQSPELVPGRESAGGKGDQSARQFDRCGEARIYSEEQKQDNSAHQKVFDQTGWQVSRIAAQNAGMPEANGARAILGSQRARRLGRPEISPGALSHSWPLRVEDGSRFVHSGRKKIDLDSAEEQDAARRAFDEAVARIGKQFAESVDASAVRGRF